MDTYKKLLDRLDNNYKLYPDKIAIQCIGADDQILQLSYKNLFIKSNELAQLISNLKVRPLDRILIFTESGPIACAVLFACWRANVIPVPVDPSFPANVIKIYASKVKAVAICVSEINSDKINGIFSKEIPIINMEKQTLVNAQSFSNVDSQPIEQPPSNVALMLFTSGTTGSGKAVMLTQNNLLHTTDTYIQIAKATVEDKFFNPLPTHHIYIIIHGYLTAISLGTTLTCLGILNPKNLMLGIKLSHPTILFFVPPILSTIYREIEDKLMELPGWCVKLILLFADLLLLIRVIFRLDLTGIFFAHIKNKFGRQVRMVVSGGAPLNKDTCHRLQSFGLPVIDGFGITETTGTIFTIRSALSAKYTDLSLQTGVSLVDKDVNNIGEICYAGPQLMAGYFREIEKTNSVVRNGKYYTGDLAKQYPDGRLEFICRKDDAIIMIDGSRVSPHEIEELYFDASQSAIEIAVFGVHLNNSIEVQAAIVLKPGVSNISIVEQELNAASIKIPQDLRIRKFYFVNELPKANQFKVKYSLLAEWVKDPRHLL